MTVRRKVLLIGYGNPGRLDDGLGPALAEEIEKLGLEGVSVDANYQLNVEDAADIAGHDVVIFADAAVAGSEPFFFTRVVPQPALGFSSHSVEPEVVLHMAIEMFGGKTEGWALGIRGYEFNEFAERMSAKARANLEAARDFIVRCIESGEFSPRGEAPPPVDRQTLS